MKNDDPRIIQVTEDVVNRLRSAPPPPAVSNALPDITLPPVPVPGASSSEDGINENLPNLPPGGPTRYAETAGVLSVNREGKPIIETVTAYQVRQQKEAELRKNDILWGNKLKDLEIRYATSAFASQEEFDSKLEKLKSLVPKIREVPCKSLSSKVAECYSSNPNQPLRCSEEVKHFAQCVEQARAA